MHAHELIVEAYLRLNRGWLTTTNLKFGSNEVDIVAFDPNSNCFAHIEVDIHKGNWGPRLQHDENHDSPTTYHERKFSPSVTEKIRDRFHLAPETQLRKVWVCWSIEANEREGILHAARDLQLDIWEFSTLLREFVAKIETSDYNSPVLTMIQMLKLTNMLK